MDRACDSLYRAFENGGAVMGEQYLKSGRGGVREGAGRPKGAKNKVEAQGTKRLQIQLSTSKEELEEIDALCEKTGLNRSRFIRECVRFWKEKHD